MEKDLKSLLTIKVLRLVRPALIGPLSLTCDKRDLMGDLWERELQSDVTATAGIENMSLGQFLRLPQGFGNMYLGETFECYVVIQNESPLIVTNASVRVDIQTTSQKFSLAEKKGVEGEVMKTGDTVDLILRHEIKEMGKHMLICTLTYTVPPNPNVTVPAEPIFLERFFKFQVKKPLDVKTKLYNAEADEVFLEAQVQNITATPICLEKVDLEPSPSFTCIPLNKFTEAEIVKRCRLSIPFTNVVSKPRWPNLLLDVEASHQFLYRLIPKMETARTVTNIGKLDIVWKSSMGSSGRLQTSQLQRQIAPLNDLKLTVETVPDTSEVDTPFDIECRIANNTIDREMDLRLELDAVTEGYCWSGITKTNLGLVEPKAELKSTISVFPLRTGLISVSGIKLVDMKRGEKFCFNDLTQVLIFTKLQNKSRS